MLSIDLNCDMGESTSLWQYNIEKDIALLQYISSMNLACGFHAGDAHTMHDLVDAALMAGVAIGAHPGFPDKENFGRTNMSFSPANLYDIVLYQIGALHAFLQIQGAKLHHVKPHGALYNMAAKDALMSEAICKAVKDFDADLILYGLSGSELIHAANSMDLKNCSEVFADRTYQDDGSLTPRSKANAIIEDTNEAVKQVLQMLQQGEVTSTSGGKVKIVAETICIHGDGVHAWEFAQQISHSLKKQNILIRYPTNK
jgi:5-oxoprolinase (ATP-hydrolysing) subunit A